MFGLPVAPGLDPALLAEPADDEPGDPPDTVPEALVEGAGDGGLADAGGTRLGDPGVDGLDVQPANKIANVAAITTNLARQIGSLTMWPPEAVASRVTCLRLNVSGSRVMVPRV